MATTYATFLNKMGGTDVTEFVGKPGTLFFDPSTQTLRISDGSTPGGVAVNATAVGGQIEVGNTDLTRDNFFKEQANDVPCFDFYVSQITNEYITIGEYSLEEEFGDADLSEYVLEEDFYTHGSSIYYKDSIILAIKLYDIPNFEEVIANEFCNMYGLETIHEDNKNGKYFTKNGKKIGSYFTVDENTFYVLINTKPIPDKIKTLFKRKTFEDTSFLDLTLESFCEDINNSKFNIDLKLNVDSDYYEPFDNKFEFSIIDFKGCLPKISPLGSFPSDKIFSNSGVNSMVFAFGIYQYPNHHQQFQTHIFLINVQIQYQSLLFLNPILLYLLFWGYQIIEMLHRIYQNLDHQP